MVTHLIELLYLYLIKLMPILFIIGFYLINVKFEIVTFFSILNSYFLLENISNYIFADYFSSLQIMNTIK